MQEDPATTPRVAAPGDAGVVAEMLHAFNLEFSTQTPGPQVLAERLRRLLARDDVVALLAGEPAAAVGLITFRPGVWDAGPVALLEELYVRPELRGGGIGHLMLERALAIARDRGSETFEINVDEGDTGARRFYEAHGFANTEPGQTERLLYYFRKP
jgi:GNAT superfamily N-acetyltransferase